METDLEQLQEVGHLSLEERCHQADMHLMHKIMNGEGGLDANTWCERASTSTHATRSRADPFNIRTGTGRLELRRNFYGMRMIRGWNRILAEIKSRPGTARFKAEHKRIGATTMHPA